MGLIVSCCLVWCVFVGWNAEAHITPSLTPCNELALHSLTLWPNLANILSAAAKCTESNFNETTLSKRTPCNMQYGFSLGNCNYYVCSPLLYLHNLFVLFSAFFSISKFMKQRARVAISAHSMQQQLTRANSHTPKRRNKKSKMHFHLLLLLMLEYFRLSAWDAGGKSVLRMQWVGSGRSLAQNWISTHTAPPLPSSPTTSSEVFN